MPRGEAPHPPSVDRVLRAVRDRVRDLEAVDGEANGHRDALLAAARDVIDTERERLRAGREARTVDQLGDEVVGRLDGYAAPEASIPPPVINATGVILHTNLGRAPWPDAAIDAARDAARTYGYLELDTTSGRRGPRFRQAEDHLVALTGAEDALIVNNNAAAVALAVGLAGRGGVAVSRGELVEIGGGVRIPEIVRRAGAKLVEVGTTNRTRASDFEAPLADGRAKLVLRVHPSNFTMAGFVEEPDPKAVADLAHRHGAIVVDDLGSGALLDTAEFGLAHEPTPAERLAAGSDVVTFSGDKLVGGPQAGLIVGRSSLIARLRRDPLARAMRPDKVILAATAATLGLYRAGATSSIPIWRSIGEPAGALRRRAEAIAGRVPVEVAALDSPVGGGSLPGQTLPSWGVALRVSTPDRAARTLREGPEPILARIVDDAVVFDLRTVPPEKDSVVAARIEELAAGRR
jgi:L-seryl-tRNA(Ser) seleniumtransferase